MSSLGSCPGRGTFSSANSAADPAAVATLCCPPTRPPARPPSCQFVDACNQLGVDKAVPKRILDLMGVQGLTRENVASHLQKYRLVRRRRRRAPPSLTFRRST